MKEAGLPIIDSQSALWEIEPASKIASAMLGEHPEIKGLLCCNDSMALGALAAVKGAGREGEVLIVGYDGISAVEDAIKEGSILATADQHADQLAVFGIEFAPAHQGRGAPLPTSERPSIWSPSKPSGNPEPMDSHVTPRTSSSCGSSSTAIAPRLCLRGIGKSYATPVLQDVDLDLLPGEVHALMGANGAGKSTLGRIISGLVQPDAGSMTLDGSAYRPAGKAGAESFGVQIVQQEPTLIPTLNVAENLFLNRLPARWGVVRPGLLRRQAIQALAAVGLDRLDPMTATGRLGIGEQQLVEIARALACLCRVLILDEPTAALSSPQVERLFLHVAPAARAGVAIIYISHRLDEVRRIADRITVLRDGRLVATRHRTALDLDEAVRLMVGANSESKLRPACHYIRSGLAPGRAPLPGRAGPRRELRGPPGRDSGRLRADGFGADRATPRGFRRRPGRFRSDLSRRLGPPATFCPSSPGDSRWYWHGARGPQD